MPRTWNAYFMVAPVHFHMYDRILLPTDGRPGSGRAAALALDLAETYDATVHVLYVVETRPELFPEGAAVDETLRERLEERGRAATVDVQNRAEARDVALAREIREGSPTANILEYVEESGVDLVVMGASERQSDRQPHTGSTTRRVLSGTNVPVVTVPLADGAGDGAEFDGFDRVVVATDGSEDARRAGNQGLTIAQSYGAEVRVVYVVDSTAYATLEDVPRSVVGLLKEGGQNALEGVAAEARERDLTVSTALLRGVPAESLRQYVAGADADLLTMGARGRSMSGSALLGSTTERFLRQADLPVLTMGVEE